MAGMDDLMKGLGALNTGLTQFATTNALNDATSKINDLNAQGLSAVAKRQQQGAISQGLAMQLTKVGANPQQVAQMTNITSPDVPKNANDAMQTALQSGHPEDLDYAKKLQDFELTDKREARDSEESQAETKAANKGAVNIQDRQEAMMGWKQLDDLNHRVNDPQVRAFGGRLANTDFELQRIKNIAGDIPANASDEAIIKQLNGLKQPQVAEINSAFQRAVTQAAPTDHSQEVVLPETKLSEAKQLVGNLFNTSLSMSAGERLLPIIRSVQGMHQLVGKNKENFINDLSSGAYLAQKWHKNEFDNFVGRALVRNSGNVGGQQAAGQQAPSAPSLAAPQIKPFNIMDYQAK